MDANAIKTKLEADGWNAVALTQDGDKWVGNATDREGHRRKIIVDQSGHVTAH